MPGHEIRSGHRIGVFILLRKEGKILLIRRKGTGYRDGWYSMPSGHLEKGEAISAAAVREAREEVGIRIDPVEPKDTTRRCSACSAIRDISLGERTYSCMVCGLRIDRDINAARNILHKSTAGHAGIEARGDPASLHPETDAKAGPSKREHTFGSGSLGPMGSPGL